MLNTVLLFVVNYISFWLFFFTVPYMTGKEIVELSQHGLYKGVVTGCTNLGHAIYRAVEESCRLIARALDFHPHSMFYSLLNVMLYIVVVTFLNGCYNTTMAFVINYEPEEFKWIADTSYSKLSDILLVCNIVGQFLHIESFWQIFPATLKSIGSVLFFLFLTVLHFCVMTGLLEYKVEELHPLTKEGAPNRERMQAALSKEFDLSVGISWVGKAAQGVMQFIDDAVRMRNYQVAGCGRWFAACVLCWSLVQNASGASPDFGTLLLDVLDESELLNTFMSFLLSAVLAKGTLKTCKAVYDRMPAPAQARVDKFEEECVKVVYTVREKRTTWARKMDGVYTKTKGLEIDWTPRPIPVDKHARMSSITVQNEEVPAPATPIVTLRHCNVVETEKEKSMSNSKFVTSLEEAYAQGKDYFDGTTRWTFLKGCLVDLGVRGDIFRVLTADGSVQECNFGEENQWGITKSDRSANSFGF